MLLQCIVGCVAVLAGLLITLGLVRLAANLVIALVGVAACAVVVYSVVEGFWSDWPNILWRSLVTGGVFALLSLPVLPFSSFRRRR